MYKNTRQKRPDIKRKKRQWKKTLQKAIENQQIIRQKRAKIQGQNNHKYKAKNGGKRLQKGGKKGEKNKEK